MTRSRWVRWDRLMRALHLYTGMFLVPWMMVYAISAFLVNHKEWFGESIQSSWEVLQDTDFDPGPTFPEESEAQARAILEQLDLEGAHRIGADVPNQLVIYRSCAAGIYQVDWQRQASRLVVRQQRRIQRIVAGLAMLVVGVGLATVVLAESNGPLGLVVLVAEFLQLF